MSAKNVKRVREASRTTRSEWWLHERPRIELRHALGDLKRYIDTARVARSIVFSFGLSTQPYLIAPLIAFAREDDYFFGVLHSKVHELWALRIGTQLREVESGFRYTPTSTFETFPFPWPPGD